MKKRYKILKTVMLGFTTHNDQFDAFFDPGPHSAILERAEGGDTIYVTRYDACGESRESITQAHAIETWLEDGKIEEIVCVNLT